MKLPISVQVAAVLFAVCTPIAFADGNSAALDKYNLSDEEIAKKCQKSIAHRTNMMITPDGRHVPRCVNIYETLRQASTEYRGLQQQHVAAITNTAASCEETNYAENNEPRPPLLYDYFSAEKFRFGKPDAVREWENERSHANWNFRSPHIGVGQDR